jgi:predicted SAM-dependent methyltransferase
LDIGPEIMDIFLHVGCGKSRKPHTTTGFNTNEWTELRLDISETVKPDIVNSITDMHSVKSGSVKALFSSHNIEHLYAHDVQIALAEFQRVISDDGFAVITCPDLQSICRLIAEDKLNEPAYNSSVGPIAPIDILYGYRPALSKGALHMAHRCGFTKKVLTEHLYEAGFKMVEVISREYPNFDLWAVASVNIIDQEDFDALVLAHFPK